MDNKKLLKFLIKDIAEIEELFAEKGSDGFDEFETEFVRSRFKEARQLIQLLSGKDKSDEELNQPENFVEPQVVDRAVITDVQKEEVEEEVQIEDLPVSEVQEELEEVVKEEPEVMTEIEKQPEENIQPEPEIEKEEVEEENLNTEEEEPEEDAEVVEEISAEEEKTEVSEENTDVELEEEKETEVTSKRLGDSFSKEKSVNELLANDSNKLEFKISNSPVKSIQSAIGINDRYQYIRELFEGNADAFVKAVSDLDNLNNIQEAVSYLQQNYKWKKTETSLKFVNLIKRRFPNG